MRKDTFSVAKDSRGREYVYQAIDEGDKNHDENDAPDATVGEGRMYDIPGNINCPVLSFKKYITKLHPGLDDLWQRPLDAFVEEEHWYSKAPLGKNPLSCLMKDISASAKLSKAYTNHSVRATHITVLDDAGFEARHIMRTSGHKSESSIRSYSHRLSDTKKHQISATLSKSAGLENRNDLKSDSVPSTSVQAWPESESVSDISDIDLLSAEKPQSALPQSALSNIGTNLCTSSLNFCPTFNNCNVTFNMYGPPK
jgi:hypothetical protein